MRTLKYATMTTVCKKDEPNSEKGKVAAHLQQMKGIHFYKEQQMALLVPGYISYILK